MLYLVGLGLGDAKDITMKGLEAVQQSDHVFLENYTSILSCGHQELERVYGKTITLVDREMMEQGCEEILNKAKQGPVSVLVVGDPLNATTHTDLLMRAAELDIPFQIIHNASIVNAVACCGLQIYSFGETVSIPMWTETWQPDSFVDKILNNRKNGLHTLCLLDIKIKEPNLELLARGIIKMEPAKFLTAQAAAVQLMKVIETRDACNLTASTTCIALARVGWPNQKIVRSTVGELVNIDMGEPLHSIVIPGDMHPMEESMVNFIDRQRLTNESMPPSE